MVTILICLGYLKLYKHHLIIPIFHKTRSLQYQKTKRKYSQIQGLPQRLPCVHFSHFIEAYMKSLQDQHSHTMTALAYLTGKFPKGAY